MLVKCLFIAFDGKVWLNLAQLQVYKESINELIITVIGLALI